MPSHFEEILELCRTHAPNQTSQQNAQHRKESVSNFTEDLVSLADSIKESKTTEFIESSVDTLFKDFDAEDPVSLTRLKNNFKRSLKRPVNQLLGLVDAGGVAIPTIFDRFPKSHFG